MTQETEIQPISPDDSDMVQLDGELEKSVPSAFRVCDEASASWVVRRVLEARRYGDRVEEWFGREKRRSRREEEFFLARYGGQLQSWVRGELGSGKRRSINLPGGTTGFRRVGALLVIANEDVVLNWARRSCPAAVIVAERLSKTAITDHFAKTGELPPDGAFLQPEQDRFYVR